ncbi:MAG TPA: polyphosphate kinase 1, partial [Methylophilaceae bacterium]|nr:polyphosphate kinase 1 [Methylophilaceae bacterium]
DRDLSILAFNRRVLDWAKRKDVPLLERLRYLCIVSSNLDEFFEVRGVLHQTLKGQPPLFDHAAARTTLCEEAHVLVAEQYSVYNDILMPEFARQGLRILSYSERNEEQHAWVADFFQNEVRPLLLPVVLDPSHPFPQVANKSLNFIVRLSGHDAFGRSNDIAIVKVPRSLPRVIRLPGKLSGKKMLFVSISSVIRAHLKDLFPGREVGQFSQFRITRHSDLAIDEEDVKNLRTALRQGLIYRHYGEAVRLEVSAGCNEYLSGFLLKQFKLPEGALYRVHGPVNLVRLNQLIDLVEKPKWLFPKYEASYPHQLSPLLRIFSQLQKSDVIIHQPYENYDAVLAFLREAVRDPNVLAIKQTIYRTGPNSVLMDLLYEAVQRNKEVTVVMELKARFDEETNINWADKLESIGAQVVYGVVGLKTHAKMLLVSRREGHVIRRYAHLSTGNYNPTTARIYTDISHLTCDPELTEDIENVFSLLANQSKLPKLHKLWVAPFNLQSQLLEQIESLTAAAAKGTACRVVLKMNALTDEKLMQALIHAGQAGVKIDLVIRGACMLPAQRPGYTDRIRVVSVVGRFLEHSRVFYFQAGAKESLYLSSADWMNRNMLRRVELAWPVTDPQLRQRLIEECLTMYLQDKVDAWTLDAKGQYQRPPLSRKSKKAAQARLMQLYEVKA